MHFTVERRTPKGSGGELQLAARTLGSAPLHREVHVLRRSWRTLSSCALAPYMCRLLFCVPLSRVERTVDLAATRCAVLGARGGGLEPAATSSEHCAAGGCQVDGPFHPREGHTEK